MSAESIAAEVRTLPQSGRAALVEQACMGMTGPDAMLDRPGARSREVLCFTCGPDDARIP